MKEESFFISSAIYFFRPGVVLERVLPVLADSAATEQGKLL